MGNSSTISQQQLDQYRDQLRSMRTRISGDIEQVVETVRDESNEGGNLSGTPVHMGDIASDRLEADINVMETESKLRDEIDDALQRIGDGTFGICDACGQAIRRERLDAIPYARHCITCAEKQVPQR